LNHPKDTDGHRGRRFVSMTFSEAQRRLLALGDEVLAMKFGLRNMRVLLRELGSPHRRFRSIHVGGTNGKGSVCAMVDSVLRASGRRVGLFTSPHLTSIRERMQVNGRPISRKDFVQSYQRVALAVRRLQRERRLPAHPTYFETITAIAFDFFAHQKLHVAVLEVGMGGRLDSTNLVTPLITAITNVDFDHERFLGDTIEKIAREKAGIIKRRVAVLTAARRPAALRVIRQSAAIHQSQLIEVLRDSKASHVFASAAGSRFSLRTPHGSYHDMQISLAGRHQVDNAVLAVRILEECDATELRVSRKDLFEGLKEVRWPGRFEQMSQRPDIFVDGAHNPAGARALRQLVSTALRGRKIILIYGAMRDKAIRRVVQELQPIAEQIIFTRPFIKRAATPEKIFALVGEPRHPSFLAADLGHAIKLARRLAQRHSAILITGSLYLVGEARKLAAQSGG
jgi:dihydrofolate synthase/folylpolyglutamate synthase